MSRVINTDSTGKRRNQNMRTAAEILRHLSKKQDVDDDVKDMLAALVFCFREIDEGIEQSTIAWEKRDYWMKAEDFRRRWYWVGLMESEIKAVLQTEAWHKLPEIMVKLMPYLADIKVTKFTRKESDWRGSYDKLMSDLPSSG